MVGRWHIMSQLAGKMPLTWNPNDPCFDWKRPCFGGFNHQNRGQTGSMYILPSGGLYATYHLLREPETTIDIGGGSHPMLQLPKKSHGPLFFQLKWEAKKFTATNFTAKKSWKSKAPNNPRGRPSRPRKWRLVRGFLRHHGG